MFHFFRVDDGLDGVHDVDGVDDVAGKSRFPSKSIISNIDNWNQNDKDFKQQTMVGNR